MSIVVKIAPDLRYKPVWLTGELDFPVEMTHGHLVQTSTGVRGGAAREFERELKWGCERFKAWMESEGKVYIELPLEMAKAAEKRGVGVAHGFVIDGPFLPMTFAASKNDWLMHEDGEPLPRKRETSLRETGGKVCYRMAGLFLVREQLVTQVIDREKDPERWGLIAGARKRNGLWSLGEKN